MDTTTSASTPANAAPTTDRVYAVEGMSCAHCVRAITDEVSRVAGVTAVDVELATGRVTVRGGGLDDDAIRAAIGEAGFDAVVA
jgi:copper chaperone CopZ